MQGKANTSENNNLQSTPSDAAATATARNAEMDPDLALIVKSWPNLPEHIKMAIKALVQTHTGEKQK